MKKYMILSMLLTLILVISGCKSSSDTDTIRKNNEQSIIQALIDARLSNYTFEEIDEIHTKYRTSMEYTVWDNYFDVSHVSSHPRVAIAENYNLVPKSYSVVNTAHDVKDGIATYIYTAKLKAVPTGSELSSTDDEREFTVYFVFEFDEESILTNFYTANRLERLGGDS